MFYIMQVHWSEKFAFTSLKELRQKKLNLSFGPLHNNEVVFTWLGDEDKIPWNTKLDIK